ncbi:MAG: RtcB family protein, partial [Lachnospiraceae bacterium]|nr:RtcB family protein [Lachnospiraceae bacterium]
MQTIKGKFAEATVFTDLIEDSAIEQIRTLCDQPFTKGCQIRIMPDVHSGAGCVIGFTADLGELVIPNIVGVDIGCGMLTVELGKNEPDYKLLDTVIHQEIPSGMTVYDEPAVEFERFDELFCLDKLRNIDWLKCSLGTLGGGNHFIEVDKDDEGVFYLVIHTGSRNLGKQVAEFYQQLAIDKLIGKEMRKEKADKLIEEYKAAGRMHELQQALKQLKSEIHKDLLPKELCYLSGKDRDDYLHDMRLCQEYAVLNRRTIAERILNKDFYADLSSLPHFETIHNYIDHDS